MPRLKTFWLALVISGALTAPIPAQETQTLFLSGHGKDDAVPWKFLCTTGPQSGYWTNLPVPSNWELHGFGHLNYRKDPTNVWIERGLYEKEFTVPVDWSNRRVFLVFEGAMTDTSAKLNGESVGPMHQGGFFCFKYEVTSLIKPSSTNWLEVTVAKHSANESVNKAERQADYWLFGGIYRPVHLDAVPAQFIDRVAVDARADGTFRMNVFLDGATDANYVEAQIQTLDGQPVGSPFDAVAVVETNGVIARVQTQLPSPQLWTAEAPQLYQVEVRLRHGDRTLHRVTQRFGFRTFEVRDGDGLYLNGSKIILKGVCRHSFWPDSGRCLSEAVQRLDITTIKEMNANAVRMSHYPPDAEFLDLCDELGLYVLDELPGWHNHYDNTIGPKLVSEMVTRDVNHPSILFWDNGNEGGFNTNLDGLFGQYDPQGRRVLHPWASFNGLCTAHYLAYEKAEIAAGGTSVFYRNNQEIVATNDHTKYIYMPTEFQHSLYDGGGGAGLADYWSMMMSHTNCAGGFIWAFLDEAVRRPDTGMLDTSGNEAPDGIVGPYREREASYYAIKEIWAPTNTIHSDKRKDAENAKKAEKEFLSLRTSAASASLRLEKATWIPSATNLAVAHAGKVTVSFDKQTGLLADVQRGTNHFSLSNGPRPAHGDAHLTSFKTSTDRKGVTFTAWYEGNLKKVTWHVDNDGTLRCDYTCHFTGTNDYYGVIFDYPEQFVKTKQWLGDGPFRVWKNRLAGNTFGVWSNSYNDTITGDRGWIYPEFKGCFADVRRLQLETTEGRLTIVPEKILYVQVLTPAQPPDKLVAKTKINLPQCGLGFLHAIPPIGSKFKAPAALGPHSQPNIARGDYSGSICFYFDGPS